MLKKFRKLKMFKQLSIIMFIAGILAFVIVAINLNIYLKDSVKKHTKNLKNDILNSGFIFLQTTSDRLHSMAVSYSKWDDMVKATENKDMEWIKDNTTDFLTNNDVYMLDFIYFKDLKNGFSGSSGVINDEMISIINKYSDPLFVDENIKFLLDGLKLIMHNNDDHYIISICPIIKTDNSNFRGYYVV